MATARRRQTLPYDPTYGDRKLSDARRDLVVGRWQGARDLLRDTGRDWDRRTHRIRLLAEVAAGNRTVEAWQAAQPGSADALVLRADTEVMRVFAAVAENASTDGPPSPDRDSLPRQYLDDAAELCLRAARTHPADPMPWISLVTLARLYAHGHRHTGRWWEELLDRDPHNREGHHQVLRHLSARWHGSYGRMYDFARDCAAQAPPGSPLAVLVQAARAEHYRHRVETEGNSALGLSYHWSDDSAVQALHATVRRWIEARTGIEHAQHVADLNLLAHGLVYAGMTSEAREAFRLLGNRPTRVPWSYCGEPDLLFARWRDQLVVPSTTRW